MSEVDADQINRKWRIHFGGFRKLTLIDYPGKLAAIAYTAGCNLRCPWCHNPSLVVPTDSTEKHDPDEILSFLESRKQQLDGLVITGGEPTLWPDLERFVRAVKTLGISIKLDTNGTRPETVRHLMAEGLIDYIAMDVKAPPGRYAQLTNAQVDTDAIRNTIQLIRDADIPYEFRTTLLPSLHRQADLEGIGELVSGASRYVLQGFRPGNCLDRSFDEQAPTRADELKHAASYFAGLVGQLEVRG